MLLYFLSIYKYFYNLVFKYFKFWGLGIGDWAQSPIPNPQVFNNNNFK